MITNSAGRLQLYSLILIT